MLYFPGRKVQQVKQTCFHQSHPKLQNYNHSTCAILAFAIYLTKGQRYKITNYQWKCRRLPLRPKMIAVLTTVCYVSVPVLFPQTITQSTRLHFSFVVTKVICYMLASKISYLHFVCPICPFLNLWASVGECDWSGLI